MNGYCVLSVKKYHTFNQLKSLEKHNNRDIPLPNVDKNFTHENKLLYAKSNSYTTSWRDILKEAEAMKGDHIQIRRNAVIAIEVVMGFSKDTDINLDLWTQKSLEWVEKNFGGSKNIIASTLHMDETSPHIHTEIVPITEDGRLCAKDFLNGKLAMMQLHSSYAKEMEELGLVRGEKNAKSRKKDLNKFYKSVNSAASASLPPQMRGESDEDYLLRMEKYCKTQKMAVEKLKIELEQSAAMTDTKIAQEISKYTDAVSFYEDLFESSEGDTEFIRERLTTYRKLENRIPKETLDELLKNLLNKFEEYATPLTNWTILGKNALKDIKKKIENEEQTSPEYNIIPNNISNQIPDDIDIDEETESTDDILDI